MYNIICNIFVCFFLCIAASLLAGLPIDWVNFGINYAVSFVIAMLIGMFIPLVRIGKWFTALFHVKNDTFTHNIKYRLLATLITSAIFFIIINPSLTILNYFILKNCTILECLLNWLINIPIMFLVGFLSSLVSDLPAYKVANKIDNEF